MPARVTPTGDLRQCLAPWLRRLWVRHLLTTLLYGSTGALVVLIPFSVIDRFSVERTWMWIGLATAVVSLVAAVVWSYPRRPDWRHAARVADQVAGLREQALTALTALPESPPELRRAQYERAVAALRSSQPGQLTVKPPAAGRWMAVALAAALTLALLWTLPNPLAPIRAQREAARAAAAAAEEYLDEARRHLEQDSATERRPDIAEAVDQHATLSEAMTRMEELLRQLRRTPDEHNLAAARQAAMDLVDLVKATGALMGDAVGSSAAAAAAVADWEAMSDSLARLAAVLAAADLAAAVPAPEVTPAGPGESAGMGRDGSGGDGTGGAGPGNGNGTGNDSGTGGQGGDGRGTGRGQGQGGGSGNTDYPGDGGGSGWGMGRHDPLTGADDDLPGLPRLERLPTPAAPRSVSLPAWSGEEIKVEPDMDPQPAATLRQEFAVQASQNLADEPLPEGLRHLVELYFGVEDEGAGR